MKHVAQHRNIWRHIWWLATIVVFLVVTYVVAGRLVMQLLPQWRAPLVQLIQKHASLPLSIGRLDGHMQGLTPVLELHQVRVQAPEANANQALLINRVSLAPDLLMSLMHRSVWLRELHLSGLQLTLEQQPDGSVGIAGFPQQKSSEKDGIEHFLSFLYQLKRVVVDQIDVSLKLTDTPLVSSQNARLEMLSSGGHHQLAVKLTTAHQSLDLRLKLKQDAYQLNDLRGNAYMELSGSEFQQWFKPIWKGVELSAVEGKLIASAAFNKGKINDAGAALQLDKLALTGDHKQWQIGPVTGRLGVRRHNGYQLQLDQVDVTTDAGRWQPGPIMAWWQHKDDQEPEWKVSTSNIDLAEVSAQQAAWQLPLPDSWQLWWQRLKAMAPSGVINGIYAEGKGHKLNYVDGRVSDISIKAVEKLPGVEGVNGWFAGSPEQGVAKLEVADGVLDLPIIYHHPLPFAAQGALQWFWNERGFQLQTGRWNGSTPYGHGQILFGVAAAKGQVPTLHLLADANSDKGHKTAFYIPDNKIPEALGKWLKTAIKGGKLNLGRFLYEGPVHIDRDRQQDRTFQLRFDVSDASLEFLPGWPPITGASGNVLVDGHQASAEGLSGQILHSKVSNASFKAWINPDDGWPRLRVQGDVKGPVTDVNTVLQQTPLTEHLPEEVKHWQLSSGQVKGNLQLGFVLHHGSGIEPSVTLQASTDGLTLENNSRRLHFTDASGAVRFDLQKGIEIPQLKASWLDQPFTGSVTTNQDRVAIRAKGRLAVKPLIDWLGADWLTPLSGASEAELDISLPWRSKRAVRLNVTSQLQGVALDLPAPLGKAADEATPFRLSLINGNEITLSLRGKSPWKGRLRLADQGLAKGAVAIGAAALPSMPRQGLAVEAKLPTFHLQPWMKWAPKELAQPAGSVAGRSLLQRLTIDSKEMLLFGLPLDDSQLTLAPTPSGGWEIDVSSEQLQASARLPKHYKLRGSQPMDLHVKSFSLSSSPAGSGSVGAVAKSSDWSALTLPNANVSIDQIQLGANSYGQWSGQLRPVSDGVRIDELHGIWREALIDGTLWWNQKAGQQYSRFKGKASSDDIAKLQRQWGLPAVIESDEPVKATADLSWQGTPLALDYMQLSGPVSVRIGSCQLPNMDKNNPLLRLIGAFNVSSIKRRLKLDFSDLYKKGLSCDSIKAALTFNQQQLEVQSLKLKSPSADIQLSGDVNLQTKALDSDATVVLPLSSNLYAGCIAGPAVCAGIFVFDRLLGDQLEKAAALDYHVGGSWSKPVVKEK